LLLAVPGCGGDEVSTQEPSAALKASEASYEQQIAKEKAAYKKGGAKK
jgi:hypothetical protein